MTPATLDAARADAVTTLRTIADRLDTLPAPAACELLVHIVDVLDELRRRAERLLPTP